MFSDRIDAAERLAQALANLRGFDGSTLVLGIPRGGVIVARIVAERLGASLDVVVPRKLGAPGNPELAIGAVAIDGTTVLDAGMLEQLRIDRAYVRDEIERQRAEIRRRLAAYRGAPGERDPAGRTCVVVDDGIATGATAEAAVRSLGARGAARVVLAVPVASAQGAERLRRAADEMVCLETPREFIAVGQWYDAFDQVGDDEVLAALGDARSP